MKELFGLLRDEYAAPIRAHLCIDKLCEVRIINCAPIRVCYDGAYWFLSKTGLTKDKSAAFISGICEAEDVVMRACEHSLYTVADTLKRGYIAVDGGIRIGVCGCGVTDGNELRTIKNFSSVNIRLPHEVIGCAAGLAAKIMRGGPKSTLVSSPPGGGKTTILRDLCRIISDSGYTVLLCDEKHELASVRNCAPMLDVGCRTDVICGIDKPRVFEMGIACMRPDVIITDELFSFDIESVHRAVTCGIAVIASVHAKCADDLHAKPDFADIISRRLFSYYAFISGAPMRTVTVAESL